MLDFDSNNEDQPSGGETTCIYNGRNDLTEGSTMLTWRRYSEAFAASHNQGTLPLLTMIGIYEHMSVISQCS